MLNIFCLNIKNCGMGDWDAKLLITEAIKIWKYNCIEDYGFINDDDINLDIKCLEILKINNFNKPTISYDCLGLPYFKLTPFHTFTQKKDQRNTNYWTLCTLLYNIGPILTYNIDNQEDINDLSKIVEIYKNY